MRLLAALLTLFHLAVDGTCAAAMMDYALWEPQWERAAFFFAMYNAIAFGGQWAAGLALDERPAWTVRTLAASPFLLGLGCVPALGPAAQAALLGLGNCVFHAAGGRCVLVRSGTFFEPGLFVSGGAVGLALGLGGMVPALPFLAACAACAAGSAVALHRAAPGEAMPPDPSAAGMPHAPQLPLFCCAALLMGGVVLRGFGGGGSVAGHALLFACGFAAGKCLGGLFCDKAGYRNTVLAVFLISFAALQLRGLASALLLAFAFNMTMPLTLRLAHWCFPAHPGMVFGMAAGCLLPGAFFRQGSFFPMPGMVAAQFMLLFLAGLLYARHGGAERARLGYGGAGHA